MAKATGIQNIVQVGAAHGLHTAQGVGAHIAVGQGVVSGDALGQVDLDAHRGAVIVGLVKAGPAIDLVISPTTAKTLKVVVFRCAAAQGVVEIGSPNVVHPRECRHTHGDLGG